MSKNGYLPHQLSFVNKKHFPVAAIFFNFFIGILLFLPLPNWQNMVSFLVSAVVISYAMGPIGLICLRKQMPELERPFRLPFARIISLLAFYCCNLISYWTGWDTIWKLAIAILVGMLVFLFAKQKLSKTHTQLGNKALIWLGPYLVGLVLISYLGSYGGINLISFGWDFLIIGIFSLVIFYFATSLKLINIDFQSDYQDYRQESLESY